MMQLLICAIFKSFIIEQNFTGNCPYMIKLERKDKMKPLSLAWLRNATSSVFAESFKEEIINKNVCASWVKLGFGTRNSGIDIN